MTILIIIIALVAGICVVALVSSRIDAEEEVSGDLDRLPTDEEVGVL